jgi:hypothetical protein
VNEKVVNEKVSNEKVSNEVVAIHDSHFAKAAAKIDHTNTTAEKQDSPPAADPPQNDAGNPSPALAAKKTELPAPSTAIPPPPYANETFGCTQFSGPRIDKPNLRPPDAPKKPTADPIREPMGTLERVWRTRKALDDD